MIYILFIILKDEVENDGTEIANQTTNRIKSFQGTHRCHRNTTNVREVKLLLFIK